MADEPEDQCGKYITTWILCAFPYTKKNKLGNRFCLIYIIIFNLNNLGWVFTKYLKHNLTKSAGKAVLIGNDYYFTYAVNKFTHRKRTLDLFCESACLPTPTPDQKTTLPCAVLVMGQVRTASH